jgi:hypothetical protein
MTALELFDGNGQPTEAATGHALKLQGLRRALKNAGDEWKAEILAEFRAWCATRRGTEIVIEDFRAQVPSALHPGSPKAWGSLPRMAVAEGLLRHTGRYQQSKSPKTHAHPVALWEIL